MAKSQLITVGIVYYLPDYRNLLNSFYWQTTDLVPEMPRTHAFLKYWKSNIDAVIRDVLIWNGGKFRTVDWHFDM